MADRTTPYLAFNFIVSLSQNSGTTAIGGFSDVSGLSSEITEAEYRSGNALENHVIKLPSINKTGDVTCKRGIMGATDLYDWFDDVRTQGYAKKHDSVIITLLDEQRNPKLKWTLRSVTPKKLTGPTLAGKGGADVAMEELVLSAEKIEFSLA
jgi:phage tail-like protein